MPARGSPGWPGAAPGRQHRGELRAPRRSALQRTPAAPRPLRAPRTAAHPQGRALCAPSPGVRLAPARVTFIPRYVLSHPARCVFVCVLSLSSHSRAPRAVPQPVVALEGLISQQ